MVAKKKILVVYLYVLKFVLKLFESQTSIAFYVSSHKTTITMPENSVLNSSEEKVCLSNASA